MQLGGAVYGTASASHIVVEVDVQSYYLHVCKLNNCHKNILLQNIRMPK